MYVCMLQVRHEGKGAGLFQNWWKRAPKIGIYCMDVEDTHGLEGKNQLNGRVLIDQADPTLFNKSSTSVYHLEQKLSF